MLLLRSPIDVFLSHDWPGDIWKFGDIDKLIRLVDRTGQLRQDVLTGQLGNPMTMEILNRLKPSFAFAGHMHMHFNAIVPHDERRGEVTRFMALDKCGFRRQFVQWIRIDGQSKELVSEVVYKDENQDEKNDYEISICYDAEWLAILKKNNKIPLSFGVQAVALQAPTEQEVSDMHALLENANLTQVAPGFFAVPFPGRTDVGDAKQRRDFCAMLGMVDVFSEFDASPPSRAFQASEAFGGETQAALFFEDDFRV